MNNGERDELICKIILVYLRDNKISLFNEEISSVGFLNYEYSSLSSDFDINYLRNLNDEQLIEIARSINIAKAPSGAKSDVYINNIGVSLKSLSAAPTALVNHTARPGFEFACNYAGIAIDELDEIIDNYWQLRESGLITEDTKISDKNCPFRTHKEYLRPILEYFLFIGTGSKISETRAEYILEFTNPFDLNTYKKLSKKEAVDAVWPKLIFSLRAKKGMPKDYTPETYNKANAESILKWVRYNSGDYRGALHIRSSK